MKYIPFSPLVGESLILSYVLHGIWRLQYKTNATRQVLDVLFSPENPPPFQFMKALRGLGNDFEFYGRFNDLIYPYNLSLGHMLSDIFRV
jgi:hypothetical protein